MVLRLKMRLLMKLPVGEGHDMIGVLGFKRVVVLLVLLVLNAALAGLVYAVVLPHIQTKEKDLRTVRSQVSNVQADIERTEIEID